MTAESTPSVSCGATNKGTQEFVAGPLSEVSLVERSGSPLPEKPHPECDQQRPGQHEPGDGVLQVIVLEMDLKRAGFRNAVWRHRLLQIDVERCDLTPAERPRHGEMIAGEPQPL